MRIFRYYLDIIWYPDYPWIGLLSARPDRIIYPPQVWHLPKIVHGPPRKIKIKILKYSSTIPPLCLLLPLNCCRLTKKIKCKLFFNYWKPILINLAVCLPKYTVYYPLLFTIVAIAANWAKSITKSFKSS